MNRLTILFFLSLNKPSQARLSTIFEPKAQIVWVGGTDRTQEIPNRDASDYRIDEANLFLLNRYQGKDYVLPGTPLIPPLLEVKAGRYLLPHDLIGRE